MRPRTIVEERPQNVAVMDVFSKLAQNRIVFIGEEIYDESANEIIAQLLYLDSLPGNEQISIYINSPGGSVYSGFAIYDTIQKLKSPVKTIVVGMAASMAAILLLAAKERAALKHARIMIHQPMGGAQGQASDIKITCDEIVKVQTELYEIISERTGIPMDEVYKLCDRDKWYTAKEALESGFITEIL